jgi:MFS transporter, DHA2 family, multidrug resistance protein
MPRGVGSLIALPIAGALMPYVDSRYIMSVGLACTAAAQLTFGHLTLDISMSNLILPNFLQGMGVGLFMVPLMAIAVGTLSKERIGNASGIFNLMRNLGGSIGISAATTFLARMTQAHQTDLVGHLSPYDMVFQERFQALTVGLARYTAEPQARMQAYAMLQGILLQQANFKAYMDMFSWLALIIASCLPGVWLLRKVATKGNVGLH